MDIVPQKRCMNCQRDFSLTSFNKCRAKQDGLQSYCRACQKAKQAAYYWANPEKGRKRVADYRKNPSGRNTYLRTLALDEYIAVFRQHKVVRYRTKREQILAQCKAYYQVTRPHQLEQRRKHYQANKQRYHTWARAWAKRNPLYTLEVCRRYQASKQKATVEKVSYKAVWERDKGICHICSKPVTGKVHFDHVVPLSRGGTHSMANIKVSHPSCNLRKSNKLLSEL